jgi:Acyl-CoA dehydrogenase, C-terminal domain
MSVFLVPRSSCKNWQKLDTHVLRNMVLTTYEIDGPGRLIGKRGHGLTIVQRMAAAARYQCAFVGMRMCQNSIAATIDHLSTKSIFKTQPIKFSNVFRQLYNLVLQAGFLNFLYNRAVVYSDTSFLAFHGTMLKSFLLLRANELLSQNWLVAGSKGFLKESIIGRDAIDSFVLPVFDGHYTINTLMTAKHMWRYLNAETIVNAKQRINELRQNLFKYVVGDQINKKPNEIRNPEFFNYTDYWKQLEVPLEIDVDAMLGNVRTLMTELDETEHPYKADTRLSSEEEYKYKTGTLVHWLESVLAAAEFWKSMDSNDYLNIVVQQYNGFVKAFNDIVSEGALRTSFLNLLHHLPLPNVEDNEAFLRNLLDIRSKIEAMRIPAPVAGD